jgi:hypothetical protein
MKKKEIKEMDFLNRNGVYIKKRDGFYNLYYLVSASDDMVIDINIEEKELSKFLRLNKQKLIYLDMCDLLCIKDIL